ncbi:hypothetical protein OHA72_48915 [Dactylosporangium sp. NBC_01737]|uniref:hypothetical protein n=1 Tax=Dactylosporangium sp. NBC_01737 TaxID=2975959 RepID=UPI002E0FAA7C|nr:hypothetical protein OHA72_48915 [Dactylosporangium sp. NBC_01737]
MTTAIGQLYSLRGTARLARFRVLHHRPSLDLAISHLGRSAARLPATHEDRPLVLAALSNGLYWRYELTSDVEDLGEALERLREAIASPGTPARERATYGADLAGMLRARFVRYGDVADLGEAVDAATDAIRNGDAAASAITNRASALLTRYEQTADLDDLLGALRDARTPVQGPAQKALHRGTRLGVLVEALSSRYLYTGDPHDLSAAVAADREALATLSRIDPNRAHYAALLSAALRLSDDAALHAEAVDVAADALRDSAPGSVDHTNRLSTLSMALLVLHLSTGELDPLRRARELSTEALAAGIDSQRPQLLQRESLLARCWFDATSEAAALQHSQESIRAWLAATTAEHPMRAALTWEYAELLRRLPHDAAHRVEVRELLSAAVRRPGPALSLHRVLRAATRLGELAADAGDARQALLGYRRAVELLPTAAWPGLRRAVREARLAEAPPATDAAAQAVLAGEPRLAVELLESGRSVMWSQQLHLRTGLDELREAAPGLAKRMDDIRGWFERPATDASWES